MSNHALGTTFLATLLVCSAPAAAGDLLFNINDRGTEAPETRPVDPEDPYAAGSFNVQVYGGAIPHFRRNVSVAFGALAAEYYVRDNLAAVAELTAVHQFRGPVDTTGGGLSVFGRWHFWEFEEPGIALYAEAGAGILITPDRFIDTNGTHFNFSLHAGFGAKWRLTDNIFLIGGPRYTHFSNARIQGKGRNPAFDGIGGYGGIQINF